MEWKMKKKKMNKCMMKSMIEKINSAITIKDNNISQMGTMEGRSKIIGTLKTLILMAITSMMAEYKAKKLFQVMEKIWIQINCLKSSQTSLIPTSLLQ